MNFAHLLDRTISPEKSAGSEKAAAESSALNKPAPADAAAPREDAAKAREATAALNETVQAEVAADAAKTSEKTAKNATAAKTHASPKSADSKSGSTVKQPAPAAVKAADDELPADKTRRDGEMVLEDGAAEFAPDAGIELAKAEPPPLLDLPPPKPASANARGQRNLIRALGLKVGRVVIDAGHGGHDTGSIGGSGLREKDLVLDIALRLGKLIEEGLGSEVIYTRNDDRFISLKERTTLANERKADLFISIHANSSRSRTVRGVETYYLNFTTDSWALTVASRENAASDRPVHELQDLLSKIALKEKIEESREFATRVQSSLYDGLGDASKNVRDRGVRKAPFMVLIGAKMPAVLAEIGFLSNPQTEKLLKTGTYRQKVANHLYKGILNYSDSLGSISMARSDGASKIE